MTPEEAVKAALEAGTVLGACDDLECARNLVEHLGTLGFAVVPFASQPAGELTGWGACHGKPRRRG